MGAGAGSLGTVTRLDGSEQVTCKGIPLDTSAPDQKPGDVKGQGINGVGKWSAASAAGQHSNSAPVAQSAPVTTSVPAPNCGGGYGY